MNTGYDLNFTPKIINRGKYIESLMDFSTPMSTMSNRWINNTTIITKTFNEYNEDVSNSSMNNDTIINNETIVDKLLQKFNQHKTNFHHTQNYLSLLDNHLHEITTILNQLQTSLDHNSLLKTTTEQIESRLLQMSIKREQIRSAINNFHQSPTISQTLNDIVQQISPNTSKTTTDPMNYYAELINTVKLSINQKINLIERFHHEQNYLKHRTNDYHSKIQQRQQLLMQLVEKILEQQKTNERYVETQNLDKPQFHNHSKQLAEFNQLTEEYQILQDENRLLKHKAKENIKTLYNFINQDNE